MGNAARSLLIGTVLVAGCASETPATDNEIAALTTATGIDYAWSHPPPAQIQAEGYSFAARYLSYDTTGKSLTPGEAQALWSAGVDVVVVWEQTANAALSVQPRRRGCLGRKRSGERGWHSVRPTDLLRGRLRRDARAAGRDR
jgi:hypothetical protein